MNFSHFYAFKNGSLGMIWDSNSSNMEEFSADERKWAMGFCTNIIVVLNIFKRA
jgi:hypothetical protein